MVWISAITFALLAAGVAMLVMGVRGRRVDDHPICRRCGRDLFALAQATARCPECGAEIDLQTGRFVRDGNRVRRPRMIASGAAAMMFGALMLFPIISDQAGWIRWYQHFPASWVILDALDDDPRRRTIGLAELSRRDNAGLLKPAEFDAYIDAILKRQADLQSTWDERWGDIVEAAILSGRLKDQAKIDEFFTNGYRIVITTRAGQWREAEVPFAYETARRAGRSWNSFYTLCEFRGASFSTERVHAAPSPDSRICFMVYGSANRRGVIRAPLPAAWTAGPGIAHLELKLTFDAMGSRARLHERSFRLSVPIEVSDTPVVASVREPCADEMRAALRLGPEGTPAASVVLQHGFAPIEPPSLNVGIGGTTPVPMACLARLETAAGTFELGSGVFVSGVGMGFFKWITPEQAETLEGTRVKLVLTSDEHTAESSMLTTYWVGEIVFEDVPIVTDR